MCSLSILPSLLVPQESQITIVVSCVFELGSRLPQAVQKSKEPIAAMNEVELELNSSLRWGEVRPGDVNYLK